MIKLTFREELPLCYQCDTVIDRLSDLIVTVDFGQVRTEHADFGYCKQVRADYARLSETSVN